MITRREWEARRAESRDFWLGVAAVSVLVATFAGAWLWLMVAG